MRVVKQAESSATQGAVEPDFFARRVDAFYDERLDPSWNGEALCRMGNITPEGVKLISNDYLGLANHPDIVAAQVEELQRNGRGVMMSDVFRNHGDLLREFEQAVARHAGAPDAVLCQSGWNANVGLIQSVASPIVPVYLDMLAHMSLWEGAQAAGARVHPFKHNDAASLERLVARHGPGVIAVDAVYSTIGSVCPLPEVARIATANGCLLVVDESHALGVFGDQGEGLTESLGLSGQVHFRTASLSKAFSARGGLVLGASRNLNYFRYESRPAIFSSAVLPHEAAGFLATLAVVRREGNRRSKLMRNADFLRNGLEALGYDVADSASQIVSLVPGPEHYTKALRDALEANGVFGSVFCAPATARNKSLVRFSVSAVHSEAELARVVAVCADIREAVRMAEWPSPRRRSARGAAA